MKYLFALVVFVVAAVGTAMAMPEPAELEVANAGPNGYLPLVLKPMPPTPTPVPTATPFIVSIARNPEGTRIPVPCMRQVGLDNPVAPTEQRHPNQCATNTDVIVQPLLDTGASYHGAQIQLAPDQRIIGVQANEPGSHLPGLAGGDAYVWPAPRTGGKQIEWVIATPPPAPAPLVNGGFESGRGVGWAEYSRNGWVLIYHASDMPVPPHSGSWAAWLGGDHNELALIEQQVTIPAGAPYLRHALWIASEDHRCAPENADALLIVINDQPFLGLPLCSSNNTGGWVIANADLRPFAGQTVLLTIAAVTNESLISHALIDDVAFHAQANVSTSQDASRDLVYSAISGHVTTHWKALERPASLPMSTRFRSQHTLPWLSGGP
jgi:hypothetical protein